MGVIVKLIVPILIVLLYSIHVCCPTKYAKRARDQQFPMMAAMLNESQHFVCAGALVSLRAVLTAAHCFTANFLPKYVFVGGIELVHPLGSVKDAEQIQIIHDVKFHANYLNAIEYDKAIVLVARKFVAHEGLFFVKLPEKSYPDGIDCHVVFWQSMKPDAGQVQRFHLYYVQMSLFTKGACELGDSSLVFASGDPDHCDYGNSGDPLICGMPPSMLYGHMTRKISVSQANCPFTSTFASKSWIEREKELGSKLSSNSVRLDVESFRNTLVFIVFLDLTCELS